MSTESFEKKENDAAVLEGEGESSEAESMDGSEVKNQAEDKKKYFKWTFIASVIAAAFLCYWAMNRISQGDAMSEFGKHPFRQYLQVSLDSDGGHAVVAPDGYVISLEKDIDWYDIADNGVMLGAYNDGSQNSLVILKNGELISVCDRNSGGVLCGSGRKLFYYISDSETVFSYDIESGENVEIYTGSGIQYVSYDGNVIVFDDGHAIAGKRGFNISFDKVIGASDSGKLIYGTNRFSTDCNLCLQSRGLPYGYAESVISRGQSEINITARSTDFSEILYYMDDDTYYYNAELNKQQLIASKVMLCPIEKIAECCNRTTKLGIETIGYYMLDYLDDSYYFRSYNRHGIKSVKNHLYCAIDRYNDTADLVYIDKNLKMITLVDNISTMPVADSKGSYVWTISGDLIYRIDLTSKTPKVLSCEIDGLSLPYDNGSSYFDVVMPIAVLDDGKSAYCIGNTFTDYETMEISGSLFNVHFDSDTAAVTLVENGVTSCASDGEKLYYTLEVEVPSYVSKLYYCTPDGIKDIVATDVKRYYIANSRLYYEEAYMKNSNQADYQFDLFEYSNMPVRILEDIGYVVE